MPAFVSIWTRDDTSEVGPTVDEERAIITVEPVGDDTGVHLVTDGAHGLWTLFIKLTPAAKAKLIADLTGGTTTGELGLPFTVAGSVAQALGQAAIDRENVTTEQVVAFFAETAQNDPLPFGEDALWDQLGPIVDQIEDAVLAKDFKRLVDGEVVPA